MAGADGERWVGLAATDLSEGSRAALRWTAANLLVHKPLLISSEVAAVLHVRLIVSTADVNTNTDLF
jgi:hypothetical protein